MNVLELLEVQTQIDSLQQLLSDNPISPENEKRLKKLLYMEWNYYSNKLEGNKLSYGETKELLLNDKTAESKTYKDHQDMKGHNAALNYIEKEIKENLPLTQHLIRTLHQIILGHSYYAKAITPNGEDTHRLIEIGQYKTSPNHVLTKSGEEFFFSTPEETPAEMHDLMKWYETEKQSKTFEPWFSAAAFHYRFIRIHPFDDGNGRMARILMNIILMQSGFPPVVIKEKEGYLGALRQADSGSEEDFIKYIGLQLVESLKLKLKAARGEKIGEENNLDKRLAVLKANFDQAEKLKLTKSNDVIQSLYENSIKPFFEELTKQYHKFFDLFHTAYVTYSTGSIDSQSLKEFSQVLKDNWDSAEQAEKMGIRMNDIIRFTIYFRGTGFTRAGIDAFSVYKDTEIHLDQFKYRIVDTRDSIPLAEKLYHRQLTFDEIEGLVDRITSEVMSDIELRAN